MANRLRDQIHCAVVGGHAIFLDVGADRYFALTNAADIDLEAWMQDRFGSSVLPDTVRALGFNGARPASALEASQLLVPPPVDELDPSAVRPSISSLTAVAAAQLNAILHLRFRRLSDVLERQREAKASVPEEADRDAQALVQFAASFELLNPVFRPSGRCLSRSIAFASLCYRAGFAVSLIFGVRSGPFGAHCWVQQDDLVLNDRVERARLFTPILVI